MNMFKVYKYLYIPRFHSEDAVDLVSHGVGSVVDAVDNVWGQKKNWFMWQKREIRQQEWGYKYQKWGDR